MKNGAMRNVGMGGLRKRFICVVAVFWIGVLAGCASTGNKAIMDDKLVSQVQAGKTKQEIINILGDPNIISQIGNGENWTYSYHEAKTTGLGVVTAVLPEVGLFGGKTTASKGRMLSITFNDKGVAENIQ